MGTKQAKARGPAKKVKVIIFSPRILTKIWTQAHTKAQKGVAAEVVGARFLPT